MNESYMFPTSLKEVQALGWEYIDVIFFSGDAFIDHPSFGAAVISRVLQKEGYRVAVVPQPNWRDDLRDFKKLGIPRLFFAVTAGAMDSMVNHYTANKRIRSDDAYTPDGKAGMRPDYCVTVYSKILKKLFPSSLVVIGGIEASLRRLTHYDYWSDSVMPSILSSSGADYLIYGMGERTIVALAGAIEISSSEFEIQQLPGLAYVKNNTNISDKYHKVHLLHSFEKCCSDKVAFVKNFNKMELEANKMHPDILVEAYANTFVVINPPYNPATTEEMDSFFDLPYTKLPHPRYKNKRIPAFDMIKNSINIHRGCFGGCSFCTIAAHQGRFIQSRSQDSIIKEVQDLVKKPYFKGVISDIGAPTANMYALQGKDLSICAKCLRKSCLYPSLCPNLNHSHAKLLELYKKIDGIKGVKRSFIGSGIRYDLFLNDKGFFDDESRKYFEEVVVNHTSGRFKIAPEHTEDKVLKYMAKPSFSYFIKLRQYFDALMKKKGLKYMIVPYFISSHPACTLEDMKKLRSNPALKGIYLDQVQDFTPTPMTASSAMYYSGLDIKTFKPLFCETNQTRKREQKSLFFRK
ncbi:MAG: YgiQ family radical SAM protein [Bacteroidales bacterium]